MEIRQTIAQVRQQLEQAKLVYGHGTANAADEAAWLVLHVAGHRPGDGLPSELGRQALSTAQINNIQLLLKRRIEERVPLAYLLGEAWFCGLRFLVSPEVLIPRSPIAELIQQGFQPWLPSDGALKILDLCTGSGCIAVAIACWMTEVAVEAADISSAALRIARRNAVLNGVEGQLVFTQSDLFNELSGRRFDLIVSNPPYVPAAEYRNLPAEFLHEPGLGLAAGDEGLDLVLRILYQAPDYLTPSGILICELGYTWRILDDKLPDMPFTWLEFSHGGEGVFILERQQLIRHRSAVGRLLEER